MNKRLTGILIFVALIAVGVAVRLLPPRLNISPVAAAALFAGFYFRPRLVALLVPLGILAIGDAYLGGYNRGVMVTVYLSLMLPIFAGPILKSRLTSLRVGALALACSVLFFLTSNAAVWYFGSWYGPGLAGLGKSYAAGLPFFRYTLIGDLAWSGIFFGAYAAFQYGGRGSAISRDQLPSAALRL